MFSLRSKLTLIKQFDDPLEVRRCFMHIAVGMSGGVDSSVTAYLLKSKGHRVTGVFMRNWDAQDETGACTLDEDLQFAKQAAQALNIELKEVDFSKEYWNQVFSYVIQDYESARTPNPDIICNQLIKFKVFLDYTRNAIGADALATGHYARTNAGDELENVDRLEKAGEPLRLFKGVDPSKDQSFFLSRISQSALRHTIFPLGNFFKKEVKRLAVEIGLGKIAAKDESMGICFIGTRRFQSFINDYITPSPGNFRHIEDGRVVGKHSGVHQWTVGQRLRMGGLPVAYCVVERDSTTNDILVAPGTNHPALFSSSMEVDVPHWIAGDPNLYSDSDFSRLSFRFQHNTQGAVFACCLRRDADGRFWVRLAEPIRALTPGQFAVFYRGDECLGSACILEPGPSIFELEKEDVRRRNEAQGALVVETAEEESSRRHDG